MRIIKQGQIPELVLHTAICRNCHTEFEFHKAEAEAVYDQRDGNYLKINCPLCSKQCTKDIRP